MELDRHLIGAIEQLPAGFELAGLALKDARAERRAFRQLAVADGGGIARHIEKRLHARTARREPIGLDEPAIQCRELAVATLDRRCGELGTALGLGDTGSLDEPAELFVKQTLVEPDHGAELERAPAQA